MTTIAPRPLTCSFLVSRCRCAVKVGMKKNVDYGHFFFFFFPLSHFFLQTCLSSTFSPHCRFDISFFFLVLQRVEEKNGVQIASAKFFLQIFLLLRIWILPPLTKDSTAIVLYVVQDVPEEKKQIKCLWSLLMT